MDHLQPPRDGHDYAARVARLEADCAEVVAQLLDPARRGGMRPADYAAWRARAEHALALKRRNIAALRAWWATQRAQEPPDALRLLLDARNALTRLYDHLSASERALLDKIRNATEGLL